MPSSKVFQNPTILKILDYYKDLWSLSYLSGLASWDLETYMPKKASGYRGEAMARVSTIRQKLFLDKEFVNLVNKANSENNLTDQEKGIVRVLNQSLKFYQKVPSSFLEEFEKLTSKSTVVWAEAKEKNDYSMFAGDLEKVFGMNRQMAEYLGYKDSPYDALLDLYEEGLTSKTVSNFFSEIKNPLQDLLKNITTSKKYQKSHWLEDQKYDKDVLSKLNDKILKSFWGDSERLRIDTSSHPFTISFNKNDTRITTRYHQKDFARSLFATIHEFGHALYDLQSSDALEMTPIAGGGSLVIHESQSRFWENHIGRSMEFIKKFKKDMEHAVGCDLDTNDLYLYFNKVSPNLLRVESDELTYHFHIMLRFEIEKGIIEGKLKVKDLKEIWNQKMTEYLGITPTKDSEGVLQDIHWAHGSVGYFPTYSLGTFLGAQWEEKITGNPNKWLEKNIHQFGSTYTLEDLLKKNNMDYDPSVNIKHLQQKYKKLYKL